MDLSFWFFHSRVKLAVIISFNPCYDGFIILIPGSYVYLITSDTFQSLLWWIYHFDPFFSSLPVHPRHPVSILVMMDLSFWLVCTRLVRPRPCFNPCYDGFIILISFKRLQNLPLSRFNPCYDGFIILMFYYFFMLHNKYSFNPCYDGFIILIEGLGVAVLSAVRFNPCYDGFIILM